MSLESWIIFFLKNLVFNETECNPMNRNNVVLLETITFWLIIQLDMLLIERLTHYFLFVLVLPGLLTKELHSCLSFINGKFYRADLCCIENSDTSKAKAEMHSPGSESWDNTPSLIHALGEKKMMSFFQGSVQLKNSNPLILISVPQIYCYLKLLSKALKACT